MAIAELISKGNELRDNKQYEEAIALYDQALAEQSGAFKALYEKSIALHRLKKFDEALGTLYNAEIAAKSRGTRSLFGQLLFRYALVINAKGNPADAIKFLNLAEGYGYEKKELDLWNFQIEKKAKKLNVVDFKPDSKFASLDEAFEYTKDFKQFSATSAPSTSNSSTTKPQEPANTTPKDKQPETQKSAVIDIEKEKKELEAKIANKDNLFPVAKDIRKDWFQSLSQVTVSLFVKNLPKDETLIVKFSKSSISIVFPTSPSSEFQYEIGPLFGNINPKESSFRVFQTKLELYLQKDSETKWKDLERSENDAPISSTGSSVQTTSASALNYPSSSKTGLDWSKIDISDDEGEDKSAAENEGDENAFFQQLYQNADDDTRRAMMKSFVESNGTSLSTNWDEVSKKKVEVSPPDGMEVKEWH